MNKAKNPIVNIRGVVNLKLPPYKVAIQEKILIPVGRCYLKKQSQKQKYKIQNTKYKMVLNAVAKELFSSRFPRNLGSKPLKAFA